MATLSVMGVDENLKEIDLNSIKNFVPNKGEIIMFDGKLDDYTFEISGNDLILTLPNGEELILSNMVDILINQDEDSPTKVTIASGNESDVLVIDSYPALVELIDAASAGEERPVQNNLAYLYPPAELIENIQDEKSNTLENIVEEKIRREFIADEENTRFIELEEENNNNSNPPSQNTPAQTNSRGPIDSTPPNTPSIKLISTSDTGTSNTDRLTKDNTPSFEGTAEPSSKISLIVNAKEYKTITDSNGNWNITVDILPEGNHTVTVTASDSSDNLSNPSTLDINIDTSAPKIPEITNILDVDGDMKKIEISGKGEKEGNTITLYAASGIIIATGLVKADGTWLIDISNIDEDKDYKITAKETDTAGNESLASLDVNVHKSTNGITGPYGNDDYYFTGSGNDTIYVDTDNNDNNIIIDGGKGEDYIVFDRGTNPVTVDLSAGTANVGGDNIKLRNIENIHIDKDANAADTIKGNDNANKISTGKGNDIVYGEGGNDTISGQGGDDRIIGGAGNDELRGDSGTDTVVFSGNYSDYSFTFNVSNSHLFVKDNRPGSPDGTDDIYSFEYMEFADKTVDISTKTAQINLSDTIKFNKDISNYNISQNNSNELEIKETVSSGSTITITNEKTIEFEDATLTNKNDTNSILLLEDEAIVSFDDFSASISHLDELNMTGGTNGTTLKDIKLSDVLSTAGKNSNDEQIMKIFGDDNDKVKLDNTKWSVSQSNVSDTSGNKFDIYQDIANNVKLYIDTDIEVLPDL